MPANSPQIFLFSSNHYISRHSNTWTPTEGAARNILEAQPYTHLWPQSVFTHTVIATNAVQHPSPCPLQLWVPRGAPALLPASAYKWSDPCLNSFGWMVFVFFHTYGSSMLRAVSSMQVAKHFIWLLRFVYHIWDVVFAKCFHRAHVQAILYNIESQHWKWLHQMTSHDYYFQKLAMINMSLRKKKEKEKACKLKWRAGTLRGKRES